MVHVPDNGCLKQYDVVNSPFSRVRNSFHVVVSPGSQQGMTCRRKGCQFLLLFGIGCLSLTTAWAVELEYLRNSAR